MQCPHEQVKTSKNGYQYTHPCGQCMACRIRRRQEWAMRIQSEALYHASSLFVTLTYTPENYPSNGSLDKTHLQKFFKRLRKSLSYPIRYFACGEYGERTQRAHYHAVIFGMPLEDEKCVLEAWNLGYVLCSELTPARAEYVAKYTTKGLLSQSNSQDGRVKEFALMSRRPGLGSRLCNDVVQRLQSKNIAISSFHIPEDTANSMMMTPIFGGSVRFGGRLLPVDRYMKDKIRKTEGFDEVLYTKTLEEKLLNSQGGSVFQEVLRRADAKLSGHMKAQLAYRKQRSREVL